MISIIVDMYVRIYVQYVPQPGPHVCIKNTNKDYYNVHMLTYNILCQKMLHSNIFTILPYSSKFSFVTDNVMQCHRNCPF